MRNSNRIALLSFLGGNARECDRDCEQHSPTCCCCSGWACPSVIRYSEPLLFAWVIETMDKTQTAAAAAAASAVVVEVIDNIQNLCCLTAPYLTLTWSSQRDRSRGLDQSPPAAFSSAWREMNRRHRHHRREHNERLLLPLFRVSIHAILDVSLVVACFATFRL